MLDDLDQIERLDPRGFGALLERFPAHCHEALDLPANLPGFPQPVRSIVLAGMGGSAIGGDLAAAVLGQTLAVPFQVARGYELPPWVGHETLVIAVSYSGNTEETLNAFSQALAVKASVAVITSGGELGGEAERRGLSHIKVPGGLPPRCALGYLLFSILRIIERAEAGGITREEIDEALALLDAGIQAAGTTMPFERNLPKQVAQMLLAKTAVIYGAGVTEPAAYRWKTQIEENAKAFAVSGHLPEADHNEVVGWDGDPLTSAFHAIFLRDPQEDPRVGRRMEVTKEIAGHRAATSDIWATGHCRLARALSLIQLGDWASYYLGLLRGVDPWPVTVIEKMKERLRDAR